MTTLANTSIILSTDLMYIYSVIISPASVHTIISMRENKRMRERERESVCVCVCESVCVCVYEREREREREISCDFALFNDNYCLHGCT